MDYSKIIAYIEHQYNGPWLVIFEADDRKVLKTGINYLVQMHVGLLFLLPNEGVSGFFGTKNDYSTTIDGNTYHVELIHDSNNRTKVKYIVRTGPLKLIRKEKLEKLNDNNT